MSNISGLRVISHHDLGGHGDGMQVMRYGNALYVGHTGTTGAGTSVLDISDPTKPALVLQLPAPSHSHTHKVQVADGLLLTNHELFPYRSDTGEPYSAGLAVYSLADPFHPQQIGFWPSTGHGVHRIVWTGGRLAHMSVRPAGFRDRIWIILDLSDPTKPAEVGRWWWPGQREDETPDWPAEARHAAHHALVAGDRAYLGYDDAGMVILDISDPAHPRKTAGLAWQPGGATHTCMPLPGRGLVVVTDEQQINGPNAPLRGIRIVDISGEPYVRAILPEPIGDFASLPMRFGSHNLHENRPNSYRSERIIFATYFSAGLRVYDIGDADNPIEIAHWTPDSPAGQQVPQTNDLYVDSDYYIYATDRINGGLTILEPEPEVRKMMKAHQLS